MEISLQTYDPVVVIQVAGSIDSLNAERLTNTFRSQVAAHRVYLVVDFTQVEYTGSAGIHAILYTLREVRQQGGDLRMVGLSPRVQSLFELSGIHGLMETFPSVAQAIASFTKPV